MHHGQRPHLAEVRLQGGKQKRFFGSSVGDQQSFQNGDGASKFPKVITFGDCITHEIEQFIENRMFTQQGIG